jgi:hypothetical protein
VTSSIARATLLAIIVGSVGGFLLHLLQVPLAWLVGAMLATMVASVARLPVAIPSALRGPMVVVLGVMLGSGFTPEMAASIPGWWATILAVALCVGATTAVGFVAIRLLTDHNRATAFFAAAPGGLTEMVLAGKAMGGDDRFIAAMQALRVMLVVASLSLWFKFTAGLAALSTANGGAPPLAPADAFLLLACGLGVFPAMALKLPAALLVGPMLCSVALHVAGLTSGKPPDLLIIAAQIVVGASVGCRFGGWTIGDFRSAGALSLLLTLLMLAIAFAAAFLVEGATGLGFQQLLLAFAPGGVAEMSLIALTLGQGVAFVATHHVFRIFLIVLVMPLAFRFGMRRG